MWIPSSVAKGELDFCPKILMLFHLTALTYISIFVNTYVKTSLTFLNPICNSCAKIRTKYLRYSCSFTSTAVGTISQCRAICFPCNP